MSVKLILSQNVLTNKNSITLLSCVSRTMSRSIKDAPDSIKSEISTAATDAVESHPSSSIIRPPTHGPAVADRRIESLRSVASFQLSPSNTPPENVRPRRNLYVNMSVKTNNLRKFSKYDTLNERALSSPSFSSKKKRLTAMGISEG